MDALIRLRLRARDIVLAPLSDARIQLAAQLSDPIELLDACIHQALEAKPSLDYRFWLHAAADVIAAQPSSEQVALFRRAGSLIAVSFRLSCERREQALSFLVRQCPALQCS